MLDIGAPELPVILVVLVLFGPKKMPELGRGLGQAIREFRHGTRGLDGAARPEEDRPA